MNYFIAEVIIEFEPRPTGVQLKRYSMWSTVIGLTAKQADCFMASMLYPFRLSHMTFLLNWSENSGFSYIYFLTLSHHKVRVPIGFVADVLVQYRI